MQGLGSLVERSQNGTVTAEALAQADGGQWGLRCDAALWVQSQGPDAGPVHLVSDHEDAYDTEGLGPDWKQETLFGPDRWQKKLLGHGVFFPESWGVQGAMNAKGLTRLKIVR